MYRQRREANPAKKYIFFGLLGGLIIAGGVVALNKYMPNLLPQKSASETQVATTNPEVPASGVIATFGQNQPTSTNSNKQVESASTERTAAPKKVVANLPAGWQQQPEQEVATCVNGKPATSSIYVNGTTQLTVYKNARPAGCDDSVVADSIINFNYKSDGSGIETERKTEYPQCDKAVQPTCPVGDGNILMYVMNYNTDGSKEEPHPADGNTYAFKIEAKSQRPEFTPQVGPLLDLLNGITFE